MVFISKILPNPSGKDTLGEFIEIYNKSNEPTFLKGWHIEDKSGKTYYFSDNFVIEANQSDKFFYSQTKISLNNSGDVIDLFSANGNLIDKIDYSITVKDNALVSHNIPFAPVAIINGAEKDNKTIENKYTSIKDDFIPQDVKGLKQVGQINNSYNNIPIVFCVVTSFILTIIFWYLFKSVMIKNTESSK